MELTRLVGGRRELSRGAAPAFLSVWVGCFQTSKTVVTGMWLLHSAEYTKYI